MTGPLGFLTAMDVRLSSSENDHAAPAVTSLHTPVFVVGHPRSGTTLLRAVLSAHSQVRLINEPDLIHGIIAAGFTCSETFDQSKRQQLIRRLREIHSCRRHLELQDQASLDRFVQDDQLRTFKQVFEYLLPRPEHAAVWGAKELMSMHYYKEILQLYPQALIIHILRDPRAAFLSAYRKRLAKGANAVPSFCKHNIAFFAYEAMRWRAFMNVSEAAKSELDSHSFCEIRFEDFVTSPDLVTQRLCREVGIEFELSMLDEAKRRDDPLLQSEQAFAHKKLAQPIDRTRATGGNEMPDWASYVIESCAADLVAKKGYPLHGRPSYYHRLVVSAGLRAYRSKMKRRIEREMQLMYGTQFR